MKRLAAVLVVAALVAAACDLDPGDAASPTPASSPSLTPPRDTVEEAPGAGIPDVPAQELVAGDAARVMEELCVPPDLDVSGDPPEPEPGDARLAEVEDQVAEIRGLEWLRPVVAEPIDDDEMDRRIEEAFAAQFPEDLYDRRTLAWRTIGAIGPDDDLHDALLAFGRGQVVGYYDPQNGELVYLADDDGGDLGISEKAVLAHELVHALDDQHFDLRRVDALVAACRDEELAAALGVVEGSAQHFSTQVLVRYPAPLDMGIIDALVQAGPEGVPPFVAQLQLLSYTEGQAFITEIADGATEPVDAALEELPPSTEQILHPERWPDDEPTAVEPIDLSERFPPAQDWRDLDVMQIGELWLRELLRLRLGEDVADDAAAGWDGGAYRAWSWAGDDDVFVSMRTAWDSRDDADAFAAAMRDWIGAGDTTGLVRPVHGAIVDALFTSGDGSFAGVSDGGSSP